MSIVYSCITRGTVILCSHQIGSGSFEQVAESMLRNMATRNDGKITYTSENYLFHCLIENGMIYICAASQEFGKQQPYAFLAEMKKSFQGSTLPVRSFNAGEHDFDSEFSPTMASSMEKYSKPGGGSNVALLRLQVDEVKDVMTQNIEKVLERGEHLDILIDKTDELHASVRKHACGHEVLISTDSRPNCPMCRNCTKEISCVAATFQKTSRKIRRKYWWKNTKMMCILALVILVVLAIIVVLICYGAGVFESSSSSSSSNTTPAAIKSTTRT